MGEFYYDVLHAISIWEPKSEYTTELKYRNDLITFLRETLNAEASASSAIWGFEHSGYHFIKKEDGRSLADIGIDDEIGIELKRNLKQKTQINRLVGQVVDFLNSYSFVIVVLCGKVEPEAVAVLKYNLKQILRSFSSPFEQEKSIKIVSKCKNNKVKRRKKMDSVISVSL